MNTPLRSQEFYTNGDVMIEHRLFEQPLRAEYWVHAGAAAICFREDDWEQFEELMAAWLIEHGLVRPKKKRFWRS